MYPDCLFSSSFSSCFQKKPKLSALEELFADEDMAVEDIKENTLSTTEKIQEEIQQYRVLPSTLISVNPVTWWWNMRDTLPRLSDLATRYLCVQASSTPSECTFSTAGDTISQERACLCPEKEDVFIFLKKNCWGETILRDSVRHQPVTCLQLFCTGNYLLFFSVRKLLVLEK